MHYCGNRCSARVTSARQQLRHQAVDFGIKLWTSAPSSVEMFTSAPWKSSVPKFVYPKIEKRPTVDSIFLEFRSHKNACTIIFCIWGCDIYSLNFVIGNKSSWRNRLARSTVNREVVGSIPTEDAYFYEALIFTKASTQKGTPSPL